MSITQLSPPIDVTTPYGDAIAVLIKDDWDIVWCCFQRDTGECWWWRNHLIRLGKSITGGHVKVTPFEIAPELKDAQAPHARRHQNGAHSNRDAHSWHD